MPHKLQPIKPSLSKQTVTLINRDSMHIHNYHDKKVWIIKAPRIQVEEILKEVHKKVSGLENILEVFPGAHRSIVLGQRDKLKIMIGHRLRVL